MGRSLLIAALLLGVPASLAAALPEPAASSPARVRAHVEFLASDLLEGRASGTRGHDIAAAYVASQFRGLGLEPAGEGGTYFQQVPMRRATIVPDSNRLTLVDGTTRTTLGPDDAQLAPSLLEKRRDRTAPLVFVGYGLDDRRLGLDDYAGLDVKGAIVVAFDGSPARLSNDIRAHLSEAKLAMAARHGAAGLILVDPKAPSGPPSRGFRRFARPVTSWVDSAGAVGDGGDLAIRIGVSSATADRLFAGAPMTLAAARAALAKGKPVRGFALGKSLHVVGDSQWEDFKTPEVVARLPGAPGPLASQAVAMMGHLDHLGLKKDAKPGEDNVYNGALDNAAGVATLLEAARRFADAPRRPARSILFVIHTGEELGLLGAQYFARHPTVAIDSIVAGVDLDMPVPLYPFTDVVAFGADHSSVAETIDVAARSMGLGVSPDPMPEEGIFTRSDHYRFVERGIPSVLLFTGYANGGKDQFQQFFQKNYHQVSDDLALPIQWDSLARYAELNYRIALSLADAAERPRWYRGDYFGDLFAPGQPRAEPKAAAKAK